MLTLTEICLVKKKIAYRIRKLRESKDYSQENMAGELNISTSAYSKIERGITDPSVGRLTEIANILDVDITYFFIEPPVTPPLTKAEEEIPDKFYGFVTKIEMDALARELSNAISKMRQEITNLKAALATDIAPADNNKTGSSGKE